MIVLYVILVMILVTTDAVTIEYILKYCLEKGDLVKLTWSILGNASVVAPVSIWRPRRKLLTPVFSLKKLNDFVNIFSQQSFKLAGKLRLVSGKTPISMWEYLTTYAMDAVCESTMGIKVDTQQDSNHPALIGITELFRFAADRFTKPWLWNDFLTSKLYPKYKEHKTAVYDFTERLIKEKKKLAAKQAMDNTKKETNSVKSLLDMMINSTDGEARFSTLDLQEETVILIGAGTDTSSVAMGFITVMLSKYPHVQEKVYQELQEVFGDSDRPVIADDLPHLPYLEAVIKETLRFYPPVPLIIRKVDKDMTLPSGVTLVEGCNIFINIWALHRNPLYWGPNAEEFQPERFIEAPLKHPAAFIAFSYGPRGCIGSQFALMSMKTAIANILRHCRILPVNPVTGQITRDETLKVKFEVMMKDVNNYMVRLEKRF